VFPAYRGDSLTNLAELPALEALAALAATGSSARPLATSDIAAMLKLASLPAYRLVFSDLHKALRRLNGLASW
jgi:hypothetical protein